MAKKIRFYQVVLVLLIAGFAYAATQNNRVTEKKIEVEPDSAITQVDTNNLQRVIDRQDKELNDLRADYKNLDERVKTIERQIRELKK